jgi:hypothetical protein
MNSWFQHRVTALSGAAEAGGCEESSNDNIGAAAVLNWLDDVETEKMKDTLFHGNPGA